MNGGEIVEVDGGHIIRSRGRKDRHSKVCTAKGPRDRRVRLSAHTAIEFYDVQDRLGFDRPSKALDWLINKAKPAIDQLAQLPPWKPTLVSTKQQQNDDVEEKENANDNEFRFLQNFNGNNNNSNSFIPFETETTSSSPIQFQSYNNSTPDLLSRTSSNDLRLSLQQNRNQNVLFTGNFDGIPIAWNSGFGGGGGGGGGTTIDTGSGGGSNHNHDDDASGGGFVFRTPSPSPVVFPAVMYGQNQYLSQRGPLQSSYSPSVRAWIDAPTFVAADYRRQAAATATGALGAGFASGSFSGFRVPARIGGDDDEVHGGVSERPSSASSDSRR